MASRQIVNGDLWKLVTHNKHRAVNRRKCRAIGPFWQSRQDVQQVARRHVVDRTIQLLQQ